MTISLCHPPLRVTVTLGEVVVQTAVSRRLQSGGAVYLSLRSPRMTLAERRASEAAQRWLALTVSLPSCLKANTRSLVGTPARGWGEAQAQPPPPLRPPQHRRSRPLCGERAWQWIETPGALGWAYLATMAMFSSLTIRCV